MLSNLNQFFSKPKEFKEPLNTAVFTSTYVMKANTPITMVSHELDGDWQFMGEEIINNDFQSLCMVVGLGEIIKKDASVLNVADLEPGYQATRANKSEKWKIQKIEYTEDEIKEMGFYCSECGVYHKDIPMAYGAKAPIKYLDLPDEEKELRAELTQDICIIDSQHFFIRGRICIPVENNEDDFAWNVWISVSQQDFEEIQDNWADENRILLPPAKGRLETNLICYPQTVGLTVKMIQQKVGYAPTVVIEETDHPLFLEQESGITMERVKSFALTILYNH